MPSMRPKSERANIRGIERRAYPVQLEVRATSDGVSTVEGYASVTESGYEMWDWAGDYTEVVRSGAFTKTLSETPQVQLLLNHGGLAMAYTRAGTLRLAEDSTGLHMAADLNASRGDVGDMIKAIGDGNVDEMSFAFRVTRQQWSPDYDQRDIQEVDIHRGDVSVVNFGANPATSVEARSAQVMADLRQLPPGMARTALGLLRRRKDLTTRMTDGTPEELVAAADQVVDQLEIVHDSGDVEGTTALITALDEVIDNLMAVMGIPDPDEMDDMPADIPTTLAAGRPRIVRSSPQITPATGLPLSLARALAAHAAIGA